MNTQSSDEYFPHFENQASLLRLFHGNRDCLSIRKIRSSHAMYMGLQGRLDNYATGAHLPVTQSCMPATSHATTPLSICCEPHMGAVVSVVVSEVVLIDAYTRVCSELQNDRVA